MRTRRSFFPPNSTIPRRSKKQTTNVIEPEFRTIVTMADNRTMVQMFQAPIKGYEDAIVVPQINANNFELKQTLINLVQSNKFTGRQDPHNHLRFFNKVTSTFRHPEVPNTTIKLLLFPFSLEGEARIWLDKEPPRSILTWEDLVSKFINQFFPPSKPTYLRNEITNFLQKPNETFNEAWERFKDLLRHKSKVRYSRSRVIDVRTNANAPLPSSSYSNSFDFKQIAASLKDKLDIRMNRFEKSLNDMKNSFITPTAPLKAVEEQNTVTQGKFEAYTTANDANLNNLQLKFDNFQKNQQDFQKKFEQKQDDFQNQMMNFMQNLYNNKPSSSSSLPSNTIPNPKEEAKAITTRSGMSYKEPPILPPGVEQKEPTDETTDMELPSPKDIQPSLVQVEVQVDKPTEEPYVGIPKAKANLPYPSRLQKEKLREKDDILAAKLMEIFRDLHFELKLADRIISKPTGVAKNVFVKVGKFHFLADFIVLDFVADPRVPLILERPFLSTVHAIINLYEREIIIRKNQQSLTIQCSDIPSVKKVEQINKIDFINAGGIDFESEEIEDFLNDDSIPFGVKDSPFNMDEDIIFLERLLSENPIPPHLIIPNQTKLPIEETNHSLNIGYEHFNTNLLTKDVAASSTKNLIPIPNECMIVSENESQSTESINDNSLDFTIISNPLLNNDKINSDVDTEKSDYLDEFYGPFIHIHILEEERTRREHESDPRQEEIDVISVTNDVLPPSDDDSDKEVDDVGDVRVDNFIQNSEHEYSESEDCNFDNPPLPLPPSKPPDKEFDFEKEISVVRNVIVKFNSRVKFDVFNDENDVLSYFMFVIFAKEFSLLSAESEDTIFDPGISE
uniref:Retrotransposon gag domain-containing protein n=1 Tax=Tanacetum cinerariifolium TaxID=118510 RepID=A0A699I7E4_TANCI|nr:hypothetical protein [Tanacetum cinerariifolium]